MNNLHNLLERFKTLLNDSKDIRGQIRLIVAKVTRIELEEGQFEIKDTTLFIKAHPSIKNSLYMYKKKILDAFSQELGKRAPKDIR